jgi:hypothetical protein
VEVKKQGFNNSSLPPRVNTLYRLEEWRGEQRVLGANFTLKVYLHNPLVGRCRIAQLKKWDQFYLFVVSYYIL